MTDKRPIRTCKMTEHVCRECGLTIRRGQSYRDGSRFNKMSHVGCEPVVVQPTTHPWRRRTAR